MKNSFTLFLDSLKVLDKMTNEQAGIFIKTLYHFKSTGEILPLDFGMEMAVTPFINQFLRDDEKYNEFILKQRENGKKGGRPITAAIDEETQTNPPLLTETQDNPNIPSLLEETQKTFTYTNTYTTTNTNTSTKTNTDIDTKNNNKAFDFFNALIISGAKQNLVNDWMLVRKNKKATNSETAFKNFLSQVNKSGKDINEVLELCIAKDWKGFDAKWVEGKNTITQPAKEESVKMTQEELMRKCQYEHPVKGVIEDFYGNFLNLKQQTGSLLTFLKFV